MVRLLAIRVQDALAVLHVMLLALHHDCVSDRLGDRVRLEPERIDWGWAEEYFPFA